MQVGEPALDGPGQAGDDNEGGFASFEPFDQAVIVKPLVGADYNRSHTGRNLGEAGLEKIEDPGGSMGVAGAQFPVPEVSAVALEAKQRMVRGSPALDGVVTDPCFLLFAVDHQHRGIHIEDDARGWLGPQGHPMKEAVMQSAELGKRNRGNTQQETPQRRSVGITWQSSEVLKDAVPADQLGRVDTVEPEQDGIKQRQKHLPNTVTIVALRQPDLSRNGILESNSGKESMQQVHPAIMGETRCTEFYGELSRPTWHYSQTYLLARIIHEQ